MITKDAQDTMANIGAQKIKLSMDIGSAFDILSILLLKSQKSPTAQNVSNYFSCAEEIKEQIGGNLFFIVLSSEEFRELKSVNSTVFDLVEAAKTDSILASQVDIGNHQRYICKGKLQKKFFDTELTEQKIGY